MLRRLASAVCFETGPTWVVTMRRWPIALGVAFVALAAGVIGSRGGGLPLLWLAGGAQTDVLDRYCVGCHNDPERAGGVSFESLDREDFARPRRRLGSRRAQAAHGAHAAARRAAARACGARCIRGVARSGARRGMGARAESRCAAAGAPDAHRVRERDPRPVGVRRERRSRARCRPTQPSAASTTTRRRSASRRRCSKATRRPRCRSAAAPSAIARWATARRATRRCRAPRSARRSRVCRSARAAAWPSSTRSRSTPSTSSSCPRRSRPRAGTTRRARSSIATGPPSTSRSTARPSPSTNPRRIRLRVPAGPQRITVALVDERRCAGVNELYAGETGLGGAVQALTIVGPFDSTGARRDAEPARDLRLPAELGSRDSAVRRANSLAPRDARVPAPRRVGRPRARGAPALLRARPRRRRRLRRRHRLRAVAPARGPAVPLSLRARARRHRRRRRLRDRRLRARIAAVVFPLEQHSGRRAARAGGRGPARRAGGARCPSRSHACGRALVGARREFREPVAACCASSTPSCRRIRTSTRICALRCAGKRSCCSPISCASRAAC